MGSKISSVCVAALALFALTSACEAQNNSEFLTLEWIFNARGAFNDLYIADLDGDGNSEIMGASSDGHFYIISNLGEELWKYFGQCPSYSISAGDIDGDGKLEALLGSCRTLYVNDYGGEPDWRYNARDRVKKIVSGFLGDEYPHLIISYGSGNDAVLRVMDKDGQPEWEYKFGGAFPANIQVADIDNDSRNEIIVGTVWHETGISISSNLHVFDADGRLEMKKTFPGGVQQVAVDDLDGDGDLDVVVGSYPSIYFYDDIRNVVWSRKINSSIDGLGVADLDGDGYKEIVVGADNVYAFDSNGSFLWEFPLKVDATAMDVGDIDGDGKSETVVAAGNVSVIGGDGKLLFEQRVYRDALDVYVADLDGDSVKEVVASGLDRNVYVLRLHSKYEKRHDAIEYFDMALESYDSGDYDSARKYALFARKIYSHLEDLQRLEEVDRLINDVEIHTQAKRYYDDAVDYFNDGDYESARAYAQNARGHYEVIGNETAIMDCDNLANLSVAYMTAADYCSMAENYYLLGDYEAGRTNALDAKEIYENMNDTGRATDCEGIMVKYEKGEEIGGRESLFSKAVDTVIGRLFYPIIIVVLLVLLGLWLRRQKDGDLDF